MCPKWNITNYELSFNMRSFSIVNMTILRSSSFFLIRHLGRMGDLEFSFFKGNFWVWLFKYHSQSNMRASQISLFFSFHFLVFVFSYPAQGKFGLKTSLTQMRQKQRGPWIFLGQALNFRSDSERPTNQTQKRIKDERPNKKSEVGRFIFQFE